MSDSQTHDHEAHEPSDDAHHASHHEAAEPDEPHRDVHAHSAHAAENIPHPSAPPPLPPAQVYGVPPHPAAYEPHRESDHMPGLAALLSIFPGLGHIYNRLYARAFAIFLIQFSLIAVTANEDESVLPLLLPTIVFFFLFNLFDAYHQAMRIRRGGGADDTRPPATGNVGFGAALIAIGSIALIGRVVAIDLSWLVAQWPFGIMLFGAWLIWRSRRTAGGDTEDALA
ncbi:MAG: hypothetical protein AAF772_21690 [Acidobacteriota bacterium]